MPSLPSPTASNVAQCTARPDSPTSRGPRSASGQKMVLLPQLPTQAGSPATSETGPILPAFEPREHGMPPAKATVPAPQSRNSASAQPARTAAPLDHGSAAAKASAAVASTGPELADCPKQRRGLHEPKPAVQPATDPGQSLPSGFRSLPPPGGSAADTASAAGHGDAAPGQTHPSKQGNTPASPAVDAAEQASDQDEAVLSQLSRQPDNASMPASAPAEPPVPTHSPDRPDNAALRQAPAADPAAQPQKHVARLGQPPIHAKRSSRPASVAADWTAARIPGMQASISVRPASAAAQVSVPPHSPGKHAGGQPLSAAAKVSAEPPQHSTTLPAPQQPGTQSTEPPGPASALADLPVPGHGPAKQASMPLRPGSAVFKLNIGLPAHLDALRHPKQPGELKKHPPQPASAAAMLPANPSQHETAPLLLKLPIVRSSTTMRPASAAAQLDAQPHKRKHATFSAQMQGNPTGSQQQQGDPQCRAKAARAASGGEGAVGVLTQSTAPTGSGQLQACQPRASALFSARAALKVGRNMWHPCSRPSPPNAW